MSFTIQRILGIAPVMVLGLLLTPAPGFAQAPKPDLVVNSLAPPPANGFPGDSFAITASVKNQGPGPAGASVTKFFLVPAIGSKKNLKGTQNVGALASGASAAPPATVTIYNDTVPGTYSFQACADGDTSVVEAIGAESNNCKTAGTITVHDVPDLVMKMISEPPLQVPQGKSFDATYKVKNVGAVPAAGSLVKFYLVGSGEDLKTEDPEAVGTLLPGATFTNTLTLTVRPEVLPGTYLLQACADSGKTVPEKDEDNCKTSVGTVVVTPQPDLLVKKATVVGAPLTINQGEPLTIKVKVRNAGLLDAPASTLTFRLASTGVIPQSKNLKGTLAVPAVAKGTTVKLKATPTVDEETIPGSYIVSACVDSKKVVPESSEGNNCTPAPGILTVTGLPLSPADLAVTALTPPPASRVAGDTFPLTATVKNNGTGASTTTTTKFNLVNVDPLVIPRTKNLKGIQIVDPLAAGATKATEVTVEVYSDTIPGSYLLEACADGEKQLHEIDEDDNCRTSPSPITVLPVPDLVVTAMGNPPSALVAGQSFPVATTYSVTNAGAVAALPSTAKFSLVSAAVGAVPISLKATVPADLAVPALNPAQVFNHAVLLKVRPNTPPGSYTLLGCADSGKVVDESDEDDNCKSSATTVQVTGLPDLIANVKLGAPSVTVPKGGTLPITVVVKNQGFANALGSTVKLSLVVAPGTAAPIKTLLESPVPAVAVAGKQTVPVTATIPTSGVPAGDYVVVACVDSAEVVPETTDENNCGTSVGIIKVQ